MIDNKPLFGGLVETHVQKPKQSKFMSTMLPGWFFEDNYGFSELGKIWVVWHPSVRVKTLAKSLQMVTCEVLLPDAPDSCVVSIVYASNDDDVRKLLWKELVDRSYILITISKYFSSKNV